MGETRDEIASSDVLAAMPSGERLPVRIVLHRPVRTPHGNWCCCASGQPLIQFPRSGICGMDSLQALALGIGLLRHQLREFVAKGGKVLRVSANGDDEVDLDAMFGTRIAGMSDEPPVRSRFHPRRDFFVNVDLDVYASVSSDAEFAVLIDGLAPVAYHLERPPGLATFELREQPVEPGPAILEFVRQIESLAPAARVFWEAATRRVFDIGFESGQRPHCPFNENYSLGPEVLAAVIRVRSEVAITIYAVDDRKHIPPELLEPEKS